MSEIAFIDVKPRRVDTGAEVTVRLAGGGTDTPYRRAGQNYRAGIVSMPRFRAGFAFDDNGWSGGTIPTNGELGFFPSETSVMTSLLAYYWRDAPIAIDAGDESGALARRLTGTVADVVANEGQMVLTIADPSKLLDKPLLGAGFTGAGGIEGPAEATGRPKRRSWGRVYNVEGSLLDKANNIYEFGDPSKSFGAFDAVRDKGRAGGLVVLAWQGSIAATFAALQVAVAPEGGCVAAPSIACVKWWTIPSGPLTADIRGENAGGYVETAAAIVAKMLVAVGGPAIANQAAADALRPAPVGIHVAVSTDTVAQAIDRLLLGISLYWVLQPDATIRIGEWAWGAPAASFQAIFIGRERQLPPVKSRKVGYRRNHRVHNDSEISAAVILADDVTYLDGTPLEALKPAEGGAQSNKPPTDKSPAPPLELPRGTIWYDDGGHPFRFGFRKWTSNGADWTSNGAVWLGGGYEDVQDQVAVDALDLAGTANATADAAKADAISAQAKINAIVADGVLDKSEKPDVVLRYNAMLSEQAGIQNNAVYYAITTEKTAYDAAVAALVAYLIGLAPAYNDYSSDTAIDRFVFNATFKAFYDARQTLLDRIAVEAGRSTAAMILAPAQSILCDYLGAPKAGQLPRTLVNARKRGNAQIDAATVWSATFPAAVTATIDTASATNDRGDISITAFNGAGGPVEIAVASANDGITINGKIAITPVLDAPPPPPPPSGSAPTSVQSMADQTNTTSSYLSSGVVIGPIRAPASGQIKLEAALSYTRSSNGENDAYGKWGYSTSGSGPFTDVPAGEVHSAYNCYRASLVSPPEVVNDPGALGISQTMSGLTSGTDYYFEFRPRKGATISGSTGATCTFSGLKKATQI
jgi:hypothetical protein